MTIQVILLLLFVTLQCWSTLSYRHPLDPLIPKEIKEIRAIVQNSHLKSLPNLTYHFVDHEEPEKNDVLKWLSSHRTRKQRDPFTRRAKVVVRGDGQTRELIADLTKGLITSDHIYNGHGYPPLTFEELLQASILTQSYPQFRESMRKRGLNISEISCLPLTMGWFGEKITRRAVKITCFYRNGTTNIYARPINGIAIVFDLELMKVIKYMDRYKAPLPKAQGTGFDLPSRINPGPTFPNTTNYSKLRFKDNVISWGDWKFHVGFNPRAGVIISTASIYDAKVKRDRRVLYRGHVNSMDLTEDWYFRTFMDLGEFGFGKFHGSNRRLVF